MSETPDGSAKRYRSSRGPLLRPAPLRHAVFDALVEMIISRELEPGEHLGEKELAALLGVSRQPVREAFQQLQAEGWVDLRPGQGAFVHRPTRTEADDLLSVRAVLERESARRAAASCTDAQVTRLWELWDEGSKTAAARDVEAMVAANEAVHSAIMEIAGNEVLAELSRLVGRRVRWYYLPIALARGDDSWSEHAGIIQAIADHDERRAEALMAAHTERTRTQAQTDVAG